MTNLKDEVSVIDRRSRPVERVVFLASFSGCIFVLCSMATPYWIQTKTTSQGLYVDCDLTDNSCDTIPIKNVEVWFHAVRTLFSLGGIVAFLHFTIASLFLCSYKEGYLANVKRLGVLNVLLLVIAIVVYGVKTSGLTYGYSFYLAIVGAAFMLIAMGFGFAIDSRWRPPPYIPQNLGRENKGYYLDGH